MAEIIKSKIAGISRHQHLISEVTEGEELRLERENNPYDSNAIKILTKSGKQLGYVNRRLAFDLAPIVDSNVNVRCFAIQVTGQRYSTKGINIEIRIGANA